MNCYDYTGRDDSDSNAAAVAFKFTVTATRNASACAATLRKGCGILKSRGRLLNLGVWNELYYPKSYGISHIVWDARLSWRGAAATEIKTKIKFFLVDSNLSGGGKRNSSGPAHPPQLSTGALSRRGIGNFGDSFDELHDAVQKSLPLLLALLLQGHAWKHHRAKMAEAVAALFH